MGKLPNFLVALIIVLAFSGCGRPKPRVIFQNAERTCENADIGAISVRLAQEGGNFRLTVITLSTVAAGGVSVRGFIANQNAWADLFLNRLMTAQTTLYDGVVTLENLRDFPNFAVTRVGGVGLNPLLQPGLVCLIPTKDNTINTQGN